MLNFLIGKIRLKNKDYISLDVNNIGFEIHTNHIEDLILDTEYFFYVMDFIKEDCVSFYGFLDENELILFKKLISVNNVGPKTALSILNSLSFDEIIYIIKNRKKDDLASISLVGSKAEHIILDLANKLDEFNSEYKFECEDIFYALKKIGFKSKDISYVLRKIPRNLPSNEALKLALKEIKNVK